MVLGALSCLTAADTASVLALAKRRRYAAGEPILEEGAEQQALFLIRSGSARVEKLHLGRPVPINELAAGELFGELSFLDTGPTSAAVVAADAVEVDVVEGDDLKDLLEGDAALASNFYRSLAVTLAQRLRHVTDEPVFPYSLG